MGNATLEAPEVGIILKISVADAERLATDADLSIRMIEEEEARLTRSVVGMLKYLRDVQEKDPDVQWSDKGGPFDILPDDHHTITPIKIRDGLWVRVVPGEDGKY